jgi:acyl-coenzyme A synthetase/AMP-(fatty) acid ligase
LKETYKKLRIPYLWRIIDRHKVNAMFTAPTAIQPLKEDPNGDFIKQYDHKVL